MKQLADSIVIGSVTTKNRIAVPPMVCFHWSDDSGRVTEKNVEHYRAMAAGGAGLIIGEATCVTKRGRLHETQLGLWEDSQTEGWKRLADTVHAYCTPLFVQLHHSGVSGIDPEADCPSDYVPLEGSKACRGHEMSAARIEEIQEAFVKAALRAKKAGLDGVELHGCHSYLICQFLNKNINRREDIYGQKEETFVLEILRGIRQACGPDFVVGIRLGAFEPTLKDGIRHAAALSNYVDFIDVSYGFNGESSPEAPEDFLYSAAFYGAQEIKKVLPNTPIFGVDGITSGEEARDVLEKTGIDMVDVARGFLVNPNFANDVLAGRDCGKCLHCKPACRWSPFLNDGTVNCPGRTLFLRRQESR